MSDLEVYSNGIVHCSVCTTIKGRRELVRRVNAVNPTGTRHKWAISKDKTFRTGQPNPCQCDNDPARQHYLMEC
jgi:hypothetical protein